MFIKGHSTVSFIDDIPAPTTLTDVAQRQNGYTFNNTKEYFTIYIKGGVSPIGSPNPLRIFDLDNYYANKTWYDNNVVVNGNRGYDYIVNEVANNGFLLYWLKVNWRFQNITDAQVNQQFSKVCIDANGDESTDPLVTIEMFDLYQSQFSTINIDLSGEKFLMDGRTFLQYQLVEDTGAKGIWLIFFYHKIEKSYPLKNNSLTDSLLTF